MVSQLHNYIARAGLSAGGRVLSKPFYNKYDIVHLSVSSRGAQSEDVIMPRGQLLELEDG